MCIKLTSMCSRSLGISISLQYHAKLIDHNHNGDNSWLSTGASHLNVRRDLNDTEVGVKPRNVACCKRDCMPTQSLNLNHKVTGIDIEY
jgi:hypothetical protein